MTIQEIEEIVKVGETHVQAENNFESISEGRGLEFNTTSFAFSN